MIEKIRKLKIKGGKFEKETPFEFFKNENQRVAIVYGRNGSGKSTIAKGFREFVKVNSEEDSNEDCIGEQIKIDLFDESNNNINNDIKDKVVVFDEKYIDENVGFKSDGLNTIVLIGNQNAIEKEENSLNSQIENLRKTNSTIAKELKNTRIDEKKAKKELDESCKFWKKRKLQILDNTGNNILDSKMNEISRLVVKRDKDDLINEYNEELYKYHLVKESTINVDDIDLLKNIDLIDQKEYDDALGAHVVESNESVKEIYELTNNRIDKIKESKRIFDNEQVCPYCFQTISDEYREKILLKINSILNKNVNEYIQKLLNLKIKFINFELYESYEGLDVTLFKDIKIAVQEYNTEANNINTKLDDKINEPFENIDISVDKINSIIEKINKCHKSLNEKINDIKSINININNFKNKLIKLNDEIAHYEIKSFYDRYKELKSKTENLEANKTQNDVKISENNTRLESLKKSKGNIKIAVKKLNEFLSYILFSKDKMSVEINIDNDTTQYIIKVNCKNVQPKDISTGERNIIALCYFFLDAMKGDNQEFLYKTQRLYVIDDPVSSFDYENRIGIMSFLRMQYDKILLGEEHNRVLILSHDIATIRDTYKCLKDIYAKAEKIVNTFELHDNLLMEFNHYDNLYNKLLIDIYNYASDDKICDSEDSIGNKMRRVLEAFSTFTYRKSIEELSTNEYIIKGVDNSDFYKNLMYRLVLHGESHLEEETKNIGGVNNFFQFLNENNKKMTARQIICLMHMLNPQHIKFQLYEKDKDGNESKAEEKLRKKIEIIEKWENEFKLNNKLD